MSKIVALFAQIYKKKNILNDILFEMCVTMHDIILNGLLDIFAITKDGLQRRYRTHLETYRFRETMRAAASK